MASLPRHFSRKRRKRTASGVERQGTCSPPPPYAHANDNPSPPPPYPLETAHSSTSSLAFSCDDVTQGKYGSIKDDLVCEPWETGLGRGQGEWGSANVLEREAVYSLQRPRHAQRSKSNDFLLSDVTRAREHAPAAKTHSSPVTSPSQHAAASRAPPGGGTWSFRRLRDRFSPTRRASGRRAHASDVMTQPKQKQTKQLPEKQQVVHKPLSRVAARGVSTSLRNRERRDVTTDSSTQKHFRHAHSTSSMHARVLPPISASASRQSVKRAPEPVLVGVMASRAAVVASESETDDVTLSPGSEYDDVRVLSDTSEARSVCRGVATETASTQTHASVETLAHDVMTSSPQRCDVIARVPAPFYWDVTESNIIISITAPPASESQPPSPHKSPTRYRDNSSHPQHDEQSSPAQQVLISSCRSFLIDFIHRILFFIIVYAV